MFNILALGFYCQIYKKRPNIRIIVDNVFIDDFDIEPHNFEDTSIPNLKFYQLNLPDDDLCEHSISLQIKNDDSNYNNGFMTKSTLIKFHTCYLAPGDNYRYKKNNLIENPLHLTIGGSGVFTCSLIKHIYFLRPKAKVPSYLIPIPRHKSLNK